MKLLELKLINFKKIKNFTFSPQGKNADILADNKVGKTTLADANSWLLADTDSLGNATFGIKTLNLDGSTINKLDHSVEGAYQLKDGKVITLKKIYHEIWTKKRGTTTKEFTGHETEHFVDGVPESKTKYKAVIAEIAEQEAFKLLTSPSYFSTQLSWTERRKLLLEVCGDITEKDIIGSNKELAELPAILDGKTCEQMKKVINANRLKINKEIEKIPTRVDEVERGLSPEYDTADDLKLKIKLEIELKGLELEYKAIESGGQVAVLKQKLAEANTAVIDSENNDKKAHSDKNSDSFAKIDAIREFISGATSDKKTADDLQAEHLKTIGTNITRISLLKEEFFKIQKSEVDTSETICPTCKRDFDESEIDSILAQFNTNKADLLAKNNKNGKELADINKNLTSENEKLSEVISRLSEEISSKQKELADIEKQTGPTCKLTPSKETIQAKGACLLVKDEIELLESNNTDALQKSGVECDRIKIKLEAVTDLLKTQTDREKGETRIEELKLEEEQLAKGYEELEKQLHLIELYTKAEVELLEGKINSRFELVHFKLFHEQINSGIMPTCEVLVDGVPYNNGLNNGSRVKAGIDIIKTLQKHYGIKLPIFIDNRESITGYIGIDCQVISLIVSESDKVLRVEIN